jgi:hypothetical protein
MEQPYVWEAWIGQKIARCESNGEATVIVLEDSRGAIFWTGGNGYLPFTVKDINGQIWLSKAKKSLIDYSINRFGDVTHKGITIHITQQASADNIGTNGNVAYFAHGRDDEGNDYIVRWETTSEWNVMQERHRAEHHGDTPCDCSDDESTACDWEVYTVRAL